MLKMPQTAYMHDAWVTFIAFALGNYAFIRQPLIHYRQHDNNVTYSINSALNKPGILAKITAYVTGTLGNKPLLDKELLMAKSFLQTYKGIMNQNDIADFESFLKLDHQNFFFKKMHIRRVNQLEIGTKFN